MSKLVQLIILGLMLVVPLTIDRPQKVETVRHPEKVVEAPVVYEFVVLDYDKEVVIKAEVVEIDVVELDLLAHLIYAEAGSDWCSDKMQQYTGSVVLNRKAHESYPNTMREVIYQDGQYSCTWNGMMDYEYNERALECARFLLENGSVLPSNVVYQAQFLQGDGLYEQVQNMYFCYKGEK